MTRVNTAGRDLSDRSVFVRVVLVGLGFLACLTTCSSDDTSNSAGLWDEVHRLEADISQVIPKPTMMPPDMSAVFASRLDEQYLVVYAHSGYNISLCHRGPPTPCAGGQVLRKVAFGTEELFLYLSVADNVSQSMEIDAVREFWNSIEFSGKLPSL